MRLDRDRCAVPAGLVTIAPSGPTRPPPRLTTRGQDEMPDMDMEKEEAIALFQRRNCSVELLRDWSPEALADLIASIDWNYQGAPEVKGALQALYEQRRCGEAHRKRAQRSTRLSDRGDSLGNAPEKLPARGRLLMAARPGPSRALRAQAILSAAEEVRRGGVGRASARHRASTRGISSSRSPSGRRRSEPGRGAT